MKMITKLTLGLILSFAVSATAVDTTTPAATTVAAPAATPTIPPALETAPVAKPKTKAAAKKPKKATATTPSAKSEGHVAINPPETGITKQDAINVRGQPSFIGEVITKLRKGESVTLLEEITRAKTKKDEPARWFRIAMPTNTPVWVNANFIDPAGKTVTPKKLQIRGGPGENFSVVGTLEKGAVVKEIRKTNDWMQIETPADAYGFVAVDLIERSAPSAPVVPPVAPEIVAVPPVTAPPTPAPSDPAPPAAPETVPPVVTPPPVVVIPPPVEEEPLPKRIVTRDGIVRRSLNVQTPSYYELESPDTGRIINYLYSSKPGFTLKPLIGTRVSVTGEEMIDARWKNTPVIEIESLEQR